MKRAISFGLLAALIVVSVSFTGCYRPYQKEHGYIVLPHQTAFLCPREGDPEKQAKLNSIEAYEACKVSSKRVIVPTRWVKTGRRAGAGEYMETMELILVDRTPVSLQWTASADTGTSKKNEAIWLESKNSIATSLPIAMTAYIQEKDAARYLFYYNRGQLFTVLNTEARNKVMEVGSEFSNSLPFEEMLTKYSDLNEKIRAVVIPYFAERGITITILGIAGFGTYHDESIAKSIDGAFSAQQLKAVELAKSVAAQKHQEVMEAMGQAEAAKVREASRGPMIAKQKISEAKKTAESMKGAATGEAVSVISDAALEAGASPAFLKIMALDVESKRVARWNGISPVVAAGPNDFMPANVAGKQR